MRKRALIFGLALLFAPLVLDAQQEPTLVLFGGKVFTNDPAKPIAQAVAIRGNTILAVGSDDEIRRLAGGTTAQVHLLGRLVIPGLNDAHTHPGADPLGFALNVGPESTLDDLKNSIVFALDETPSDLWLIGTVGGPIILDENVNRAALDKLAPRRKVLLRSFTGHGTILSSAAMQALGIADNAPDPAGGRFGRGADGKLNGRAFEYAEWPIWQRIIELTTSTGDRVDALRAFGDQAIRFGITSVQAMPLQDPKTFAGEWKAAESPLRLRLVAIPLEVPGSFPRAQFNGLKWILDGTPIEKGAALRTEYPGGGTGRENFTSITRLIRAGLDADQQLLLHASGDRTISTVFKAMESISGVNWPEKRLRLEHADGLLPDLEQQARKLGVIAVLNPTHFFAKPLFPKGGYSRAKSLLKAGIPIAIGSDGPLNPFLNIMLAADPRRGEEALTREEAVAAYTSGSAFAEFQDQKGVIAPGRLADLAVLSQDVFTVPLEMLPDTRSVLTIINGRIVYSE